MAHVILSKLNLSEIDKLVTNKEYIQVYERGIVYLGHFQRKNDRLYYFENSMIMNLNGVYETSEFIPTFLCLLSTGKTNHPVYFKNFNLRNEPFFTYYTKPKYSSDLDLFIYLYENGNLKDRFFKFYLLK